MPSALRLLARLQIIAAFLISVNGWAQQPQPATKADSIRLQRAKTEEIKQRQKEADREKKLKEVIAADSTLNTIGIDSLLDKIENVHMTLDRINSTTDHGFNTSDIEDGLPEVDSNIAIIDENLQLYDSVLEVKNLQMFQGLLNDMEDELSDWRNTLAGYNKDLAGMNAQMAAFKKDSVLRVLVADTAFRNLYLNELVELKGKWQTAVKSIHSNTTKLSKLEADVSNAYFRIIDLKNRVRIQLRKLSVKAIGKEYDYLWNVKSDTVNNNRQLRALVRKSYHSQRRILGYYVHKTGSDRLWMVIIGALFVIWVFRNYRYLQKNDAQSYATALHYKHLQKLPILSAIVALLCLAPFFDIHPPSAYVQISSLVLLVALTVLFFRSWPGRLFYYWLGIGVLYLVFIFVGAILTPSFAYRLCLVGLNIVSIIFGIFFLLKVLKTVSISAMIKPVAVVYLILNFAAIFCNLFGRLSLAKIFGNTAIFGLMQIIALSVFVQIVTEAVQLQILVNRHKDGVWARVTFTDIRINLQRILVGVSTVLWLIVFTISMNIYNILFFIISRFLTTPRKIGSTTFEIGNILLFLAIIYVSNKLQKGVGRLYEANEKNGVPTIDKTGSRLVITRLILLTIGFLLAVAASGLPMDKITIVLGALSVGIGLGLQSIVNNLVSGIILIFERPFRIGDYIELDGKKGRVRDIGIRASKLLTEDGAEIIMPNADLLSGRVVNWTLRDNNARLELPLTIEPGPKIEDVQQWVLETIDNSKHLIKEITPEILITGITDKAITLNVRVWVNDLHEMQTIKSELLNSIYTNLAQHQVKMI